MAKQTKAQKDFAELVAAQAVKIGTVIKSAITEVFSQVEIGHVVAEYDPGWSEDEVDSMIESASTYLIDQFIGSLCYNALDPRKYASNTLQGAYDQLRSAVEIQSKYPNAASDAQVDNRMRWVVQQLMQREFRSALIPLAMGVYHHALEKPYQVKAASATPANSTATAEAAKKLLAGAKK